MISIEEIKRIIFYGCSFTAGQELSDHEYCPGMTIDEVDELKRNIGHKFYTKFNIDNNELLKKNLEKSWAKWCAEELKLEYINRSKPGSSLQEIIFCLEKDLANDNINNNDLIVVGLTSADRILKFEPNGESGSLVFHDNDNRWPDVKLRELYFRYLANDYYIFYNWFLNIKYLDLLSNKLEGRLVQQYVWGTFEELFYIMNQNGGLDCNPEFSNIIKQALFFKSILNQDLSFGKLGDWATDTHAFYHPKIEKQMDFGRAVANSILKRFS